MACAVVVSYLDISDNNAGAARRTNALLEALPATPVLVQPRRHHPRCLTAPYPLDLGRRKIGINWGIFNLFWPRNARVLGAVMEYQMPMFAVCSSLWAVRAVRRYRRIPILLDAHNVDAMYMEQQFGRGHPFTRMVRRLEADSLAQVRHVFACSPEDRAAFMDRYGLPGDRITVVPNGVDTTAFDGPPPPHPPDAFWRERIGGAAAVVFLGKLDYGPNREALEFIRTDLVPALRAAPDRPAKVLILGGPVPSGAYPQEMVFAGPVSQERLAMYLRSSEVSIAPIFSGSGTRLKIIETLAARRPTVTTPKGAEGLGLTPGVQAEIAEPEQFCQAVIDLLRDRTRADALGAQGRRFAQATFDFRTVVAPKWREVFLRLIPPSTPGEGHPTTHAADAVLD